MGNSWFAADSVACGHERESPEDVAVRDPGRPCVDCVVRRRGDDHGVRLRCRRVSDCSVRRPNEMGGTAQLMSPGFEVWKPGSGRGRLLGRWGCGADWGGWARTAEGWARWLFSLEMRRWRSFDVLMGLRLPMRSRSGCRSGSILRT